MQDRGGQPGYDATDGMASVDPDKYLTETDVVGILKLNQQTVRKWIDRGETARAASRPSGADPPLRLQRAP
jgi:hypothetical protein